MCSLFFPILILVFFTRSFQWKVNCLDNQPLQHSSFFYIPLIFWLLNVSMFHKYHRFSMLMWALRWLLINKCFFIVTWREKWEYFFYIPLPKQKSNITQKMNVGYVFSKWAFDKINFFWYNSSIDIRIQERKKWKFLFLNFLSSFT